MCRNVQKVEGIGILNSPRKYTLDYNIHELQAPKLYDYE